MFPVVENGKEPAIKDWPAAASRDAGTIRAWWSRANYNIGIACEPSNLFVVDIDPGAEYDPETFPITREHSTPRGGRHLLYSGTGNTTAGKLGRHIDTRGIGGYILGPGSTLPNGRYEIENSDEITEAPAELIERAGRKLQRETADVELDAPHNIARASEWLELNLSDPRGKGGFAIACYVRDLGVSEDVCAELMSNWNERCTEQWDEDDLRGKIEHAYQYGQNEEGSKGNQTIEQMFAGIVLPIVNIPAMPTKPNKFAIISRATLAGLVEPTWLYDGWFPNEGIGIGYGGKNSYKTFTNTTLALDLAAQGRRVAYLAGEGGSWGIWQRIKAWEHMRGLEMPETFMPVGAVPQGSQTKEWMDLAKELAPAHPEMVIGDTFTRMLMGQNANDFEAQSLTYGTFESMCREMKCFGLLIGHSGKDKDRGMLGSSVAILNADVVIEIEGNKDWLTCKWTCKNMRNAEEPRPLTWQGQKIEGSLAFDTMSFEDAEILERVHKSDWERADVGGALSAIGAIGIGHSITTMPLAVEVCKVKDLFTGEPEHDDKAARIVAEGLKRGSQKMFAGFLVNPPGTPLRWALPSNSN